jgi:hypothetical protein
MRRITGLALTLTLLAAGCGRDALDALGGGRRSALRVVPDSAMLFVGQTLRFDVERVSADGAVSVLNDPDLELALTTDGVARLSGRSVQATAPGTTQLRATLGGAESRANLEVVDATLEALTVDPERARLAVGARLQLAVTGRLSDGSLVDLTEAFSGTEYASDTPSVARVGADGLVTAVAPGLSVITVNQAGVAADVEVRVTPVPDDITSLRIEPDPVSLERRASRRVRVIGIGADETILPPAVLDFTIGDVRFATVDAEGVVTAANRVGTTNLTARFEDLAATVEVTVTDGSANLVGLRIEPMETELAVGEFVQLAVIATFDDGLATDVSSDPETSYVVDGPAGVANVTATGLVVGQSGGEVVVRALYRGVEAQSTVVVTGESPVIELTVVPSPIALEIGESIEIEVIARLQSGAENDVTSVATFLPPADGALDFDPMNRTLTGVSEGFGTFGFEFGGASAQVPYVVVEGIEELELRFDPDPIVVEAGADVEFDLIAVLPDGTSVELTFLPGVIYRVDDGSIADVEPGLVRGLQTGSTVLRATASGRAAEVAVEVVPGGAELTGIELSVPAIINTGTPAQLRVIALFSDGSGQDVTTSSETSITTNSPGVVTINGSNVIGLREGEATITATFRGFEDIADVAVERGANTLLGLSFQPAALTLDVPETDRVQLIAQRRLGNENVSGDATVVLTRTPEVGIEPGMTAIGVTALRAGSGRVRAFYEGLTATLPVTVRGPSIADLRIEAPAELGVSETAQAQVFAVLTDGTEVQLQAPIASDDPSVVRVQASNRIEGVAAGETVLRATFFDFAAEQPIRVAESRVPTITQLDPGRVDVNPASNRLRIEGSGFAAGATVQIDTQTVTPVSVAGGEIVVDVPVTLLDRPTRLSVRVFNPGGVGSNTAFLQVGLPPQIDEVVPGVVIPGQTVRVRALGANLLDLQATAPRGWTVDAIDESDDARSLAFDVTVPANAPANRATNLTFRNDLGSALARVTTRVIGPALTVSGETRLTGVQVVRSLDVQAMGTLASNGPNEPLVLLVAGDATIAGLVDASGLDGRREPTPRGGEGGPGGGGGGAGGDGDATTGALGGSGQPAGDSAPAGTGTGSAGGDGGGVGAGARATGSCGAGGGGGAAVGGGGDGAAGTMGSTAGAGGTAPGRSNFHAGTGGGGGNDCATFPIDGAAGGSGGGGGGLIEIQVLGGATLTVEGTVQAEGGEGGGGLVGGGGGGGSGGTVRLVARDGTIDLDATARVSAAGGAGGSSRGFGTGAGGGGGGGLIALDVGANGVILGQAQADLEVEGGAGGSPAADDGQAGRVESTP